MLSYVNLRSFALLELLMRIFEAIFDFKGTIHFNAHH